MKSHQPRYFIGIALPAELSDQLFSFKWQLHKEMAHTLKPLVPHITLLHPSSLQDVDFRDIIPKIRDVTAPYVPLTFTLKTVEAFDQQVLYISVKSPELQELQTKLVGLLPAASPEPYHQRPYTPHVTLAQTRKPYTLPINELTKRTSQELTLPIRMTADSISLFTQTSPREYQAEQL